MTGIEWADEVWNPVTGCSKISPGCANCYAEEMTRRFPKAFPNGFEVTQHFDRLEKPYRWRKPQRVFVNSMSDLFHEQVELTFIMKVFRTIHKTPQHTYQILTKRPERMVDLLEGWNQRATPILPRCPNIWTGVSVETQKYKSRIDVLRQVPTTVRFLSCEPLLGDLRLEVKDLRDIHWVIVGGESGNNHRPIDPDWVRAIRDVCLQTETAFFFKQWGGRTPKAGGRLLDGVEWNQFPHEQTSELQLH